ncbi:MAG: PLP-dependent aspartate aminotransferase family protein [Chloroflexota bacterium]
MHKNGLSPDNRSEDEMVKLTSTQSVHAGEARYRSHNSLTVPIVQTSVYTFDSCEALRDYTEEKMFWDEIEREEYGRYGNPTNRAVEAKLAELEEAEDAILLASGMSAITSTLLLLLQQGDHLILTDESYHGTLEFCTRFLSRFGIEVTVVGCGDYTELVASIKPNTKVIFSESPTNPFLSCADLAQIVSIAKANNITTIIDTTMATPLNIRPLSYGIDLVVHSVTKYLSGHNDIMAGAVLGNFRMIDRLRQSQALLGCGLDPHAAYLVLRGLKTLALRVERQNANGLAIAQFLTEQPKVKQVWYPGLASHRDHQIAAETMTGFGGVVSFELDGDEEVAYQFINALKIPTIGPSLGGVESMISPLALMGYANVSPEECIKLGIGHGLIRFCIGIEDTDDLLADLGQAFSTVG